MTNVAEIFGGIAILAVFGIIETSVAQSMFRPSLFRIRAFSAGNVAGFLTSLSRGGLKFMLIISLQGSGSRCTATASPRPLRGPAST